MWINWLVLLLIHTGVVLPHTCRSPPVYLGEIPKADEIGRAPSSPSISQHRLQHTANLHCQYFLQERQGQILLLSSSTTTELIYSTHKPQELTIESSCCDMYKDSNSFPTIQEHRERLCGENRINCIIIFHCESKSGTFGRKKADALQQYQLTAYRPRLPLKFPLQTSSYLYFQVRENFSTRLALNSWAQ